MIDEKRLSVALHDLAGLDEPGPAPIDVLVRRGRRARFNRLARTAGVTVVAVALAAGVVAVARPNEPGRVPLELAAQTTRRTTFQFQQTIWPVGPDGQVIIPPGRPSQGAYDPVHDRGYRIRVVPGEPQLTFEERQIGDACYIHYGQSNPWYASSMSDQRPACWRLTDSAESSALGASASPGDLLAELANAGQVSYAGRTGKGKHKVDVYRFTYRYAAFDRTFEKRGSVDIDVATRRIIHLAFGSTDVTGDGSHMVGAAQDLTFSGFGVPVVVAKPTNVVVISQ